MPVPVSEVQPGPSAIPDEAIDAARELKDFLAGISALLRRNNPSPATLAEMVNHARASADEIFVALEGAAVLEHERRRQHAQAGKHISPTVTK
jgi:hypothetical protein